MAGKFRGEVGKLSKPKTSKSSKRQKGKKVSALVRRSPKMPENLLKDRIALLTNGTNTASAATAAAPSELVSSSPAKSAAQSSAAVDSNSNSSKSKRKSATKVKPEKKASARREPVRLAGAPSLKSASTTSAGGSAPVRGTTALRPVGRAQIEIVSPSSSVRERYVPTSKVADAVERTPAEAVGLRLLRQAVKDQSYQRLLPHQTRHDYEYRLRSIATLGVVQLFNSLARARQASTAVEQQNESGAIEDMMTADKVQDKKEIASREAFLSALRSSSSTSRGAGALARFSEY